VIGYILFIGVGLAVTANIAAAGYKLWSVLKDAGEAWATHVEARGASGDSEGVVSEDVFRRAYYRAYGPRGSMHAIIGLAAAAAVTYPALLALGLAWRLVWELNGSPIIYSEGLLPWQFYLFFTIIAIWVLIANVVARRYHRNRPRGFKVELARERDARG